MKKHPLKRRILFAALLLTTAGITQAADKKPLMMGASDSMISDTCAGCHGNGGVSTGPSMPTIAGLSPDYFVTIMEAYKSGEAKATIMNRIAKGYTTGEFEQMAKYYSAKKFVAAPQKTDAAMAAKGAKLHDKYCEKCHSEGGSLADDDAGILAGQWMAYTHWQIEDALSGAREFDKKMIKQLKKVHKKEGDAGIMALLHYYSSQK